MAPIPISRLQPSRDEAIEEWPWLDQDVLRSSRSRQVCMTSQFKPTAAPSRSNRGR
jgi:hypothetical protein